MHGMGNVKYQNVSKIMMMKKLREYVQMTMTSNIITGYCMFKW